MDPLPLMSHFQEQGRASFAQVLGEAFPLPYLGSFPYREQSRHQYLE